MEIVYVYQRKRREFGRHPIFSDRPAYVTSVIPSDPAYAKNYVERNPCHVEIQTAADRSEHEVNTDSVSFSSKGILHLQGGWPKDVDSTDVEHTIRYRKKVEKDEEYIKSVKNMGDAVEHCIKQNNSIDIYEEYFTQINASASYSSDPPTARSLNVFKDPNPENRTASYVSWFPDDGHKIAVAYSVLQFQKVPPKMCLDSYIWDVENPTTPDFVLTPVSPIVCLKYSTKDPHTLVGGLYNGIVSFWDTRKGSFPVDSSIIEKSHRDPVYNVNWVSSKSGSEFFSTSTDGQVFWWDTRKLSEPTESMMIDPEKNGKLVGGTVLDYESTMPTKFMVGSESGMIYLCNKKAKNPNEKITHIYPGHHGPVLALQRNPFFPKNFLSVGDWSAKIWSEDVKSPMISTVYSNTYLTDGCWSTSRPSVFYTSKIDGSIDIWDYALKQSEPALTVQVSTSPLQCIKIHDRGHMLAVTARDGSTTLLELSESLSKMHNNEKNVYSQFLERENRKEKNLESIAREKRIKATQAKRPNSGDNNASLVAEVFKDVENKFFEKFSTINLQ